jgi:RHS repeat-associated protein
LVDLAYTYDRNANVTAIGDYGGHGDSRSMGYDSLNRLTMANGSWWIQGEYRYDLVDNLVYSRIGARVYEHQYDSRNRLVRLQGDGGLQATLEYDANGNVSRRAGQTLVFDIGNRLLSSSQGLTFAYDGHGRRTQVAYTGSGASRLQMYSLEGRLVYEQYVPAPGAAPQHTAYIYLQDRLVAQYRPEAGQDALQFIHTDALGTPVVRSRAAAPVQAVAGSRRVHEPYGFVEKHIAGSGVNYTGHYFDSETGLVYMQQRYYDPIAGRFLSVDPVVTSAKDGSFFNRYEYAKNNPFKFKDPDGRHPIGASDNPVRQTWAAAFGPPKAGATQAEVGKALSTAGTVGTAVGLATGQTKVLAVSGAVSLVGVAVETAAKPNASSTLSLGMDAAGAALPPGRFSAGVSLAATAMKEGAAKLPTSDTKPNLSDLKIP